MPSETVELQGHIIDSLTLPKVLDEVMNCAGTFEILEVAIGHRREDPSRARIRVSAATQEALDALLGRIKQLGAVPVVEEDAVLAPADIDGAFPENFYCTTNLPTFIRYRGRWIEVERPEMDCGIAVDPKRHIASTLAIHRVKKGDLIAVGHQGIKVTPLERSPERNVFEFMASSVSSEKPKGIVIKEIAAQIRAAKKAGGRVMVVAGPAVVHTGAGTYLGRLIEGGWVDVLFAGNALAVHDIEQALYGTSLGVYLEKGIPAKEGHEHHMRAINTIRRAGGIRNAVERGILKTGIMAACVRKGIEFVLAGSIRDDGPLPEVITDMVAAQEAVRRLVPGVSVCVMIATMLHSIAAGNLLPASAKLVCVDINPAVVTKLTDRGSFQAVGLVTDVEPFLREIWANLSS
ncbi:MAG TPA: TIGR00300 family protein [Nitrospiria bacterium]|nr:TIGR00300 family protein [Nitrospiria bacterium]